jgi:hypothetical protein
MKKVSIITAAVVSSLLAVSLAQNALRYPDPAPEQLVKSEVIATFPEGTFLEGVAFDQSGTLYASGLFNGQGGVWYRKADGKTGQYPQGGGTLALHPNGTMYVGVLQGNLSDPATLSVQVMRLLPENKMKSAFSFPKGTSPNGLTFDANGNLFAADSSLGRIWKVSAGKTQGEVWLAQDAFKPSGPQGIPGINGITIDDQAIFTVNSSSGEIFRIPMKTDGSAGTAERYATGLTGDGIAFDDASNLYVTTHPFNRLYKVSKNGEKTIIGNAKNQIIGSTDATVHKGKLYVVTDGGFFLQVIPPDFAKLFPQDRGLASIVQLKIKP